MALTWREQQANGEKEKRSVASAALEVAAEEERVRLVALLELEQASVHELQQQLQALQVSRIWNNKNLECVYVCMCMCVYVYV